MVIFQQAFDNVHMYKQCSKLRLHPAPCVHILAAGCIDFETCAPGVCMVFPNFKLVYIVSST